jgi:hypothetical protein
MATRVCTNCGQTFDNDGNTVGTAIVAGCTHAGHLLSIAGQPQGNFSVSEPGKTFPLLVIVLVFILLLLYYHSYYYIIIIIIIIILLFLLLIQNTA